MPEQPWDYFRFSDDSWTALFNRESGFEILSVGMGFPAVITSAAFVPYLHDQGLDWHYGYLASAVLVRKIGETKLKWDVSTEGVAKGGYPH